MDNEIKDILIKLLEGQTRLEGKINGIESEAKKNSIKIESIEKKLDIIAEVQTSHKEQNERQYAEIIKPLGNKVDVIELAVKDISKDTKEVKESIEVLKEMTGKHEVDINILKRRPV